MIENMRKYTGLMIVVLVLLAAGLILTMGNFNATAAGGGKVTSVYGNDIDANTFKKMGNNTVRVISTSQDQNLINYAAQNGVFSLYFGGGFNGEEIFKFVTNRIIVKTEAEKLGIYPSKERAIEYIQTSMFAKEGSFDKSSYDQFLQRIGSTGYTEDDLINLVGEFQVYSKLQTLITNGVETSRSDAERLALFNLQTVDASVINLDIETFKKSITPTEEEIKNYWALNEGAYLTQRELQLSYILVKPTFATAKPTVPVREEGTTDEEFAKLDEAYNKSLAQWEIDKKKALNFTAGTVDDFSLEIEQDGGESFVQLAKENGFKPVTTEFFNADTAPEEIKNLIDNEGNAITTTLFATKLGTTEAHKVKAPIKTSEDGWFYARFDQEKVSIPKTYEAAKEQATQDYITKTAKEAMTKAAEEVKVKIAAALKEGKSLSDAAKAEKLELVELKGIKAPNRETAQEEALVFQYASITEPNTFSKDNMELEDRIGLVYLHKRVVLSDATTQVILSQAAAQQSTQLARGIFQEYMDEATRNAEVEIPNTAN